MNRDLSEMRDEEFQDYILRCRQELGLKARERTRQALVDGHNPACMLTRGGEHCTCPKEMA